MKELPNSYLVGKLRHTHVARTAQCEAQNNSCDLHPITAIPGGEKAAAGADWREACGDRRA
jgi:hypothetical protein